MFKTRKKNKQKNSYKQTNKQTTGKHFTLLPKKQPLPFIQLEAFKSFILHKDFVHVSEVLL